MANKKFPYWIWAGNKKLLKKCRWNISPTWAFCNSGLCPGRVIFRHYTTWGFCIFDVYTGKIDFKKVKQADILPSEYELFDLYEEDRPNKSKIRKIRIKKSYSK